MWTENFKSQQDSNLHRKTPLIFSQTPQSLGHVGLREFSLISVVHCLLKSCEFLVFQCITYKPLLGSFRSVNVLGSVDRKHLMSARFELELEGFECQSNALWTPPWLLFRISIYIGVGLPILNCCVIFYLLLKQLPSFHSLGPPDGLMCLVLVNEKFRCNRDSNLAGKTRLISCPTP